MVRTQEESGESHAEGRGADPSEYAGVGQRGGSCCPPGQETRPPARENGSTCSGKGRHIMVFIRFGLLLSLWFCPYYFLAGCFRGFEKIRDGQNYSKDFNQAVIALTIVCVFLSFYLLDS